MFRYRRGIHIGYNRQGYIHFQSLLYPELSPEDQETIRQLCKDAGGQYWRALLEYVTTPANSPYIQMKHNVSESTLCRVTREYYLRFPQKL
jgi:hypothetical protein